jgi:hypothetical protein
MKSRFSRRHIDPSQIQKSLFLVTPRRFPPPWSAERSPNCFIVRDADGQQLACIASLTGDEKVI